MNPCRSSRVFLFPSLVASQPLTMEIISGLSGEAKINALSEAAARAVSNPFSSKSPSVFAKPAVEFLRNKRGTLQRGALLNTP